MKATLWTLGLVLGTFVAASHAQAQCYFPPIPQAPDARGCGYYEPNYYGQWYGPNYCVYPPFPPFQGMVPAPPRPGGAPGTVSVLGGNPAPAMYPMPGMPGSGFNGIAAFPTHPWARSPRDFFMAD